MLHFDIDDSQLRNLAAELGATDKQVHQAFSRALTRTAATLRKLSLSGLRTELELRNLKNLRTRLRTIRIKRGAGGIRLWYGLNDIVVSAFKGRPSETAKGAEFRGQEFPGAFVAKGRGAKRTIFKRKAEMRLPLVEQQLPVKDKMDTFIEDHVFDQLEDIFWGHFTRDLRARAVLGVGGYTKR